MNSGFHSEVDENFALMGYYATYSDNSLPSFRDNLPLMVMKKEPIVCLETSARNYHHTLRNVSGDRISQNYISIHSSTLFVLNTHMLFTKIWNEFNAVHVYILCTRLYNLHRITLDFKESD